MWPSSSITKPEPVASPRCCCGPERRAGAARSARSRADEHDAGRVALVDLVRGQALLGRRRRACPPTGSRRAPAARPSSSCRRPPTPSDEQRDGDDGAAEQRGDEAEMRASRVVMRLERVWPRARLNAELKPASLARRPVSARQAASTSSARISVSPTSTASTPTRSSSSSCSRVAMPDSETTVLPAGTSASSSNVRSMSTREVGQVAVVDADHVGVELERDLELALVVDLDEHVEVERARLARAGASSSSRLERGDDQQDRVGAGGRRLVELVGVDDEVLAQDRQVASPRAPRAGRRASRRSAGPR